MRSLLAAKLSQRWFADGFFDFDADVAFVRTLMLDPAGSVRHEALKTAEANLEHLTTDDFDVLLEAASLERAVAPARSSSSKKSPRSSAAPPNPSPLVCHRCVRTASTTQA